MNDTDITTERDLWADHKADLPDEWHETFDALTAQGKSPSEIKAAIEYVTTPRTQADVSQEFNVSEVTIRNLQAAVIALGPIDDAVGGSHAPNIASALDLCTHIADALGWEEGVEYSINEGGPGTLQPHLLKRGWIDLRERVVGENGR